MKCQKCGKDLKGTEKFCPICGAKVEVVTMPVNNQSVVWVKEGEDCNNSFMFKKIRDEREKIGLKISLIIAFIAFYFPFCVIYGDTQPLIMTGYGLAGALGTSDATIGVNGILMLELVAMCSVFMWQEHTIIRKFVAIISVVLLLPLESVLVRIVGDSVKLEYGYWIALAMMVLIVFEGIWAPIVIELVEKNVVMQNSAYVEKSKEFRQGLNRCLSVLAFGVIVACIILNLNMVEQWYQMINPQNSELVTDFTEIEAQGTEQTYQDNLVGSWVGTHGVRCGMEISYNAGYYDIHIRASGGAFDSRHWEFKATYDSVHNALVYTNGKCYDMSYSREIGHENDYVINNIYNDGTGGLYLDEYGDLHFKEDSSTTEMCVFEKQSNIVVEGTDANDATSGETQESILANVFDNYSDEYILPESSERYYSTAELENLSKEKLRLARNEIYARHGRKFESADLNEYFSSQPWYNGYLTAEQFDESVLNEYEKKNLETIKIVESGESQQQPDYITGSNTQLGQADVNNTLYGSEDGISMELGEYSGTGESYINFFNGDQLLWTGIANRYETLSYGGLAITYAGNRYDTLEGETITVEWSTKEEIDYPTVYHDDDGNIRISGRYEFDSILNGS